jgi:8-oxo-dGTP pyrophosphatase MutT (NUDIX family)
LHLPGDQHQHVLAAEAPSRASWLRRGERFDACLDSGMDDQSPLSADELVDIVDEQDQVIDQAPRSAAYAHRLRHRCTFVLARDAGGRVFVHRRTARKLVFPSLYDMFVGGVVGAGEPYDEAAQREAEEELGVRGLPAPVPLFKFLYETTEHTWWSFVFEIRCEPPVAPQFEEIGWHAFLTEEELEQRLAEWSWVPDGMEAYRRLLAWRREQAR